MWVEDGWMDGCGFAPHFGINYYCPLGGVFIVTPPWLLWGTVEVIFCECWPIGNYYVPVNIMQPKQTIMIKMPQSRTLTGH